MMAQKRLLIVEDERIIAEDIKKLYSNLIMKSLI